MGDPIITNCDRSGVIIDSRSSQNDVLKFTGADTYVEGTILARDSADGKLIAFVKGGVTNEDGIPKAVLTCDITVTGAGDVKVNIPTSADVRFSHLVIDADGDNSNVDAAVRDQLRDYNIVVEDVKDLSELDNQ